MLYVRVYNKNMDFLLQMLCRFLAIHNTFVNMHNFEKRFQSFKVQINFKITYQL